MTKSVAANGRFSVLLILFALAIAASAVFLPFAFRSEAGGNGESKRTSKRENALPNYDIRSDKKNIDKIAGFRGRSNKRADEIADIRDKFVKGEKELKARLPDVKVEYNTDIRTPEVIAPDVKNGRSFLTNASSAKRSDILKHFLKENKELIGAADHHVEKLKEFADYTNPDRKLSFVELNQEINDIPVFRGEVKAGFAKEGKMIRVVNNLAPGLDYESLSTDFRDPLDAVKAVAGHINHDLKAENAVRNEAVSDDMKSVFGEGDWAPTADKMYFPTEPGVAVAAWRVLMWVPGDAFYVVVDAETGTLLFRKSIMVRQTQPATYNVYANPNAMIGVADSPFPMTPGQTSPNGVQAAGIARTQITRIGNEAPYQFNNNGWITDGANITDGNNVQAGLDRDNTNGVDAGGIGVATGTPTRVFDFPINPGIPTNPAENGGDAPVPAGEPVRSQPGDQTPGVCAEIVQPHAMIDYQRAIVTQLFYVTNRYHDEMYLLGFNEQARNFQTNNFGRGGSGNDRISAQAQDCFTTNNAGFGTPPDGFRPLMEMYLFTVPTPDFDGSLDAQTVIHELTHGTSGRLVGNAAGLNSDFAGAMGEGWSDFYAHAMLSEESDPINGVYPDGGYITYRLPGVGFNNNYYAFRRFPYAVIAATGGAGNNPHNPLTFADIDESTDDLSNGAFPPAFTSLADEVHNAGEIWASVLWEVRAKMIQRHGWTVGNRRTLQLVTDGMKLSPINPTFLSGRDAILAAALASGTAEDAQDIWAGFALRGMGAGASVQHPGGSDNGSGTTRVTEAFNLPNVEQSPNFTFTDAGGNGNGAADPGETLVLTVPLNNRTGFIASGVTLQVVNGGMANYGTIAHNATVAQNVNFTVPAGTVCGSRITLTFNVTTSIGTTVITRDLIIGQPTTTFTENFDSAAAPAFPAGWTVTSSYVPMTFVATAASADTAPNSAFAADLPDCTGPSCPETDGGSTELTSPAIPITSSAATVTFRHRYNTEGGWDGGLLEVKIGGGGFQDILASGGSFVQNGYSGILGENVPNPIGGSSAWTGSSGGYITTIVRLPAAAAGQNMQLRFRFGTDNNTGAPSGVGGWNIDTLSVTGNFSCQTVQPPTAVKSRADFDADGRTDLSVFRGNEGNWYMLRSTEGFIGIQWGGAGDIAVPGDYDGDGRADTAVYRPGAQSAFYVLRSQGFVFASAVFGQTGDVPVAGDYDGDDRTDVAVFRPSVGGWYSLDSSTGIFRGVTWGQAGDVPVPADYDGDGRTDQAVRRGADWYLFQSTAGFSGISWGFASDRPVPADYDGDDLDDIAVFRENVGGWYILRSTSQSFLGITWGQTGDVPVPGDYDADGRDDQAVFRNGEWYMNQSTAGFAGAVWGSAGDIPVPARYIP